MAIAVNSQTGQAVCLGEDHAAGVGVGRTSGERLGAHAAYAVAPRPLDAPTPKGVIEAVVGVAGDDAYANLAQLGEQAGPLPGAILLADVYQTAIGGWGAVGGSWFYT